MNIVTGATGHLGNTLVRMLLAKGEPVRAVVAPGASREALAGLGVNIVEADVRNPCEVCAAIKGGDVVYHLAGLVWIKTFGSKRLQQINVEGARNVIRACQTHEVKKLVYVSSIHAFENKRKRTITETTPVHTHVYGSYGKTKAAATLLMREASQGGLHTVVVHPTGLIGPNDYCRSNLGQIFEDCLAGKLWAYLKAGHDFVDVRDVANGLMLAAEKGQNGQSYILSGHFETIPAILDRMRRAPDVKVPTRCVPMWLAQMAAPWTQAFAALLRKPPLFTSYSINTLRDAAPVSHAKATRELGYTVRSIDETVADALAWYRQYGYNARCAKMALEKA